MQKVVILGSTGSLGIQTLEVLKKYSENFTIIGLSANKNQKLLNEQKIGLKIEISSLSKQNNQNRSSSPIACLASRDGVKNILKLASNPEPDIIINLISGIAGIAPSIAALKAGKILILGNKESLVAEGKQIMKLSHPLIFSNNSASSRLIFADKLSAKNFNLTQTLIPLDSEHNAIFEILHKVYEQDASKNLQPPKIKKIYLPCSGGPFYGKSAASLAKVTSSMALNHPRYKMGPKISIESATLINKGLEIIEAHYLFNLPLNKIKVFYHPECQIHGIVEFENSKFLAYFSPPDMREHIENCLRRAAGLPQLGKNIRELRPPDLQKNFPNFLEPMHPGALSGIAIIRKIFQKFRNSPTDMKRFLAHEEKVINKFLAGQIKFLEIFSMLKKI